MYVTCFMSYLIFSRFALRTPGLSFGRNDVTSSSRCYHQTLQYVFPLRLLWFSRLTVISEQCWCDSLPGQLESWRCRSKLDGSIPCIPHGQLVESCSKYTSGTACFVFWWTIPIAGWIPYASLFSLKDEPKLNLLTEAMDRIHRLGQRRPVQAIKLVVEDSIESRIVQVSYTSGYR